MCIYFACHFLISIPILELLRERHDKMNYTEEIIVSLVDFVMTILVVPDRLEEAFEKDFYQHYILKHKD